MVSIRVSIYSFVVSLWSVISLKAICCTASLTNANMSSDQTIRQYTVVPSLLKECNLHHHLDLFQKKCVHDRIIFKMSDSDLEKSSVNQISEIMSRSERRYRHMLEQVIIVKNNFIRTLMIHSRRLKAIAIVPAIANSPVNQLRAHNLKWLLVS